MTVCKGADPKFCPEINNTERSSLTTRHTSSSSSSSSLSAGKTRSKSPTLPSLSTGINADVKVKCLKCGKRRGRANCSQSACLVCCTDEDCNGHRESREKAKNYDSILDGTNWINRLASEKRSLAIKPGVFHETSFHYLDETVYLWNMKDYFANPKWRDDAIRRSKRNNELRQRQRQQIAQTKNGKITTNTTSPKRQPSGKKRKNVDSDSILKENRRERFKRIMDSLYDQSLQSKKKKSAVIN